MRPLRRIVHAADFSRPSRRAFAVAIGLARLSRGELTVVNVRSPAAAYVEQGYVPPRVYERILRGLQAKTRRELDRVVAAAKRSGGGPGGCFSRVCLTIGSSGRQDPHGRIPSSWAPKGRTGLARVLLGSAAARVIATAPCPALTVRSR